MTVSIKPVDPVNRAFFAGEVSGIDLRKPLTKDEVAAVHAGMDQFGVLVFHDQDITDDQQLVFSRSLGPLEQATGDIAAPQDRRMSMDLNDISNLDKNNKILARDDRRRLFGLGNQLWHSDSSFKPVPVVAGQDLVVLVEVGDVVQVHAHAPVLRRGDVAGGLLERPQAAAEDELLVVVDLLVVEHQHAELVHAGVDGGDFVLRERLAQVEAGDFAGKEGAIDGIDGFDADGHGGSLA